MEPGIDAASTAAMHIANPVRDGRWQPSPFDPASNITKPIRSRAMPTFEYLRLLVNFRHCEALGPGAEKFAGIEGLDAMLAALGAEGWELVTVQGSASDMTTYLFKRQGG